MVQAAGKSLPEIEGREFSALSEFEQPLVEASIRLRNGGSDGVAATAGCGSCVWIAGGLVNDNRAWALVGLGGGQKRLDSGMSCLITQMKDCGLKSRHLRLQTSELSNQLIELMEAAGESLPEIEDEFSALSEFEQPLVEASIRLRSGGSDELSLQLLDAAVAFGLRSGLVNDNRAWGLVGLGQRTEAFGLWNELLDHPDEGLRTQARDNLRLQTSELSNQLIELIEATGESCLKLRDESSVHCLNLSSRWWKHRFACAVEVAMNCRCNCWMQRLRLDCGVVWLMTTVPGRWWVWPADRSVWTLE